MEISSLSLQHKAMESAHLETQHQQEKKARSQPEQSLKCPRCDSTNTKFCYYNNYNLSQPRYFCKGCRRYWTKGGSLRNVPVGGGCRRNGKTSSSSKKSQDQDLTTNPLFLPPLPLPPLSFDPNDLTLAFASLQNQPTIGEKGDHFMLSNPNSTPFLDILRGGSFQSLYYGFGGNVEEVEGGDVSGENGHMMFSLDGGILNGTINSTAAADKASGDHGGADGTTSMATWWG